jgi:hypothetical protein
MTTDERLAARRKEAGELGHKLQTAMTNALGEHLCRYAGLRVLKLSSGMIEWTEVIARKEYRCAVYLDTRLEIVDYDDPEAGEEGGAL